jgi:hypothetical protein
MVVCVLPAVAALLPVEGDGNIVAAILCAGNVVVYGVWAAFRFRVRIHLTLAVTSLVLVAANWPATMDLGGIPVVEGVERWLATLGALAILAAFSWRHPAAGVAGAVAVFLLGGLLPWTELRGHWRMQSGLIFLLLHSLRWQDDRPEAAAAVWWIAGLGPTAPVLAAAGVVSAIVPVAKVWTLAGTAPGGVLAILASLLLFVLGTMLACTRHLWQRTPAAVPPSPSCASVPPSPADGRY